MFFDNGIAQKSLGRIVRSLTANPSQREDLQEDAWVHLWLLEEKKPGQTLSWYLQNCRFHVQHRLAGGRSLDSPKHGWTELLCPSVPERLSGWLASDDIVAEVSAHDILAVLDPRLLPRARRILLRLAEGCTTREIARELRITHQAVSKQRKHIAAVAEKLGITPLGAASAFRPNGRPSGSTVPPNNSH